MERADSLGPVGNATDFFDHNLLLSATKGKDTHTYHIYIYIFIIPTYIHNPISCAQYGNLAALAMTMIDVDVDVALLTWLLLMMMVVVVMMTMMVLL